MSDCIYSMTLWLRDKVFTGSRKTRRLIPIVSQSVLKTMLIISSWDLLLPPQV